MKSQHKGLVQLRDLTVLHISLDSHEETVENVIEIAKERQARKVEGVKLLSTVIVCGKGDWQQIGLDGYRLEMHFRHVVYRMSNVSTFDLLSSRFSV